jgi:hypothetical protein
MDGPYPQSPFLYLPLLETAYRVRARTHHVCEFRKVEPLMTLISEWAHVSSLH